MSRFVTQAQQNPPDASGVLTEAEIEQLLAELAVEVAAMRSLRLRRHQQQEQARADVMLAHHGVDMAALRAHAIAEYQAA